MSNKGAVNEVFPRSALATDIPVLETLLNRCYLFEKGWTNETNFVS